MKSMSKFTWHGTFQHNSTYNSSVCVVVPSTHTNPLWMCLTRGKFRSKFSNVQKIEKFGSKILITALALTHTQTKTPSGKARGEKQGNEFVTKNEML